MKKESFSLEEQELLERINWFIRLRYVAAIGVIVTCAFANKILLIEFYTPPVYIIGLVIAIYNTIFLFYSKSKILQRISNVGIKSANRFANIQISVDLFTLTLLIHFSGGAENPFAFYFIFHMIIASILLSPKAVYIQATLAISLFGIMIGLEYYQIIPHHHLHKFIPSGLCNNPIYILGEYFVFTTTMYLAVYMATSITKRLRKRQEEIIFLKEELEEKTKELEEVNKDLIKLDHLKTEFVSMASHELRGPLSSIQSLLKVILEGMVGEVNKKQRELIERVERRIMGLIALINDLLDFSRIRIGRIVQRLEPFQVSDIIQKVIELATAKAVEKNITLQSNIPSDLPLIRADRNNIEQVFTNLIDNALNYTLQGGKINVNVGLDGNYLKVEVSDTGIGIAKEDLDKIFDTFYRADNAREVVRIGTGLGLSIVKQIVEVHGGRIEVESEIGKGSNFIVFLPKI